MINGRGLRSKGLPDENRAVNRMGLEMRSLCERCEASLAPESAAFILLFRVHFLPYVYLRDEPNLSELRRWPLAHLSLVSASQRTRRRRSPVRRPTFLAFQNRLTRITDSALHAKRSAGLNRVGFFAPHLRTVTYAANLHHDSAASGRTTTNSHVGGPPAGNRCAYE